MSRRAGALAAGLLMMCWLLAGCNGRGGLLPSSGGRLYEVLLVADREGLVRQMLETDVEGLPQSEPSFDVSAVDSTAFGPSLRQARSIVVVRIDASAYPSPHVGYERNVWAKPQLVVRIGAPSVEALRRSAPAVGQAVRRLLLRAEMGKTLSLLRHKRNTQGEQTVRRVLGVDLWIPADMVASREDTACVWFSNNGTAEMQNIVVYREPALPADDAARVARFVTLRNKALARTIRGETDSMWMTTVAASVVWQQGLWRGLWEMHGDDMGGPFVSRRLEAPAAGGRAVVAEGFVFAPGRRKRNAIRRLEALLHTLRWHTDSTRTDKARAD